MIPKIKQMLTRLAVENTGVRGRFKLAAGIVYKSQLIATGINSYKSHPIMCEWGTNAESIYLHAEIDAIKNALKLITQSQLAKCDIYIVRVKHSYNVSGNWEEGLAKPCPGCRRAIESFGLKRVFWTEDNNISVNSLV
jgi:tRNA(Arg) A34 adenosine deaminase TadA